jgi:tetraacyldisaccharide 4'-kinase
MKKSLVFWGEKYLFSPGPLEWLIAVLLLPLSFLYCCVVWIRYKRSIPKDFGLPIISVGNLIVGGSGKTPLTVALAKPYKNPAIVLRGYARASTGLFVVSNAKEVLCDVKCSGDEAMLYANLLPHAIVIVAEDRVKGIEKAKSMGAEVIFLDDGYSKHFVKKLDLLIMSKQKNPFCLPSGPFREILWSSKEAVLIVEDKEFVRKVNISSPKEKMVLVTAISKPQRLDTYLDERVIKKVYFPDHHAFTRDELSSVLGDSGAYSLLVTRKDAVKITDFDLPLSFLELELEVDKKVHQTVQDYVRISSQI